MARNITFESFPAYTFFCPVCNQRWVGSNPEDDPATDEWVRKHGVQHQFSDAPPSGLVLAPPTARLGALTNGCDTGG